VLSKVAAALLRQHSLNPNEEAPDFYKVILIDKEEVQTSGSKQRIESCLSEDPAQECAEVLGVHRVETWEVRLSYTLRKSWIHKATETKYVCRR
jgi:hypothetical protein